MIGPIRELENCNNRKLSAKALQDVHSEMHLSALIRKTGPIEVKGIVLSVLDHSVDVVLLYLGIIRRLYLDVRTSLIIIFKFFVLFTNCFLVPNGRNF